MHDNFKFHLFKISIGAWAFDSIKNHQNLRLKLKQEIFYCWNVKKFDESYVGERYVNTLKWQQPQKKNELI